MPATSWLHRLRRRRRWDGKRSSISLAAADDDVSAAVSAGNQRGRCREEPAVAEYLCSPNRGSYYLASADRGRRDGGLRCVATRDRYDDGGAALDIRVRVVHRRAVRLSGIDAPPVTPELNLRPVLTKPPAAAKCELSNNGGAAAGSSSSSSGTTSAATTPSTRARGFHVKPAGRRRRRSRRHGHDDGDDNGARKEPGAAPPHVGTRRRRWLYESLVVVKESSDPEREMAESMAEMVMANRIVSPEDLEELLACYLALNASEHHRAVVAAFRRVWLWLRLARPPPQRSRGAPP